MAADEARRHEPAVLVLTAVAACTDAISYLGLDKVFPANMTGNTVLLGIGLATGQDARAARSALALLGFVLGAAAGALLGARLDRRRRLVVAGAVELAVLAAACGWWWSAGAHVHGLTRAGLILLVSVAMGVQSAAVTSLGVGVSATYITGTWTQVSAWAARRLARRDAPPGADDEHVTQLRRGAVVVCYFAAAVLAAYVHRTAGTRAVLLPALLLVLALALLTPRRARDRQEQRRG